MDSVEMEMAVLVIMTDNQLFFSIRQQKQAFWIHIILEVLGFL